MKAPAIIASLTIVGSLAYANGQRNLHEPALRQGTLSGLRSRLVDQGATSTDIISNDEERIQASLSMLQGSPGETCASDSWFDPTPLAFDATCGPPAVTPTQFADVNLDGIVERFQGSSIPLISGGPLVGMQDIRLQPEITCLSYRHVQVDAAGPRSVSTSILATPATWAAQLWNELGISNDADGCIDSWIVGAEILGWADCDGDRDLDIVLRLTAYHRPRAIVAGSCSEVEPIRYVIDRYHWFRNTGYEKPAQPLAADINGDGRVDGADLGMLLVAWGPTP